MTRKKAAAFIIAVLSLFSIGLLTAPGASSTALTVLTAENYGCAYKAPPGGSPDQWRTCDGTWYHAQPKAYGRTIRIVAEIAWNADSNWHYQGVYYANNLTPALRKDIKWYCRYPNHTTSGLKGTTTLGGGYAASHSWSPVFQPCNGYGNGLIAQVHGLNSTNDYDIVSTIDINSDLSGAGHHSCACYTES